MIFESKVTSSYEQLKWLSYNGSQWLCNCSAFLLLDFLAYKREPGSFSVWFFVFTNNIYAWEWSSAQENFANLENVTKAVDWNKSKKQKKKEKYLTFAKKSVHFVTSYLQKQ